MKTFPKCQGLQECGCGALQNLTFGNVTFQEKAIESGGIELLLPALDNHLDSAFVCERACLALFHMGEGGKKNTWLLLRLGGGAALAKVSTKSRSHEVAVPGYQRCSNSGSKTRQVDCKGDEGLGR
jgi:hypothetical protein